MYDALRFFCSCLRSAMQNSDWNAFHKKRRGRAETRIRTHPRKNFWLIKYYFPFTCKNIYFCFLFSPQSVKSILAFLSCKNDVMALLLANFYHYLRNSHNLLVSETHNGLKRVTRVQCSWIFTFTIFGNLSDRYPFSTKWLPRDQHADVLRQKFCISSLKIHR